MTGGTLGTADGFLLGTSDGATLGESDTRWLIDGQAVGTVSDEVATFDSLTLTIRTTTEELKRALRPAKTNENQVSVLSTDNGGYISVDRANGSNTFTFTPPSRREPLRVQDDYRVAKYEEELVSQTLDEWDVELELIPSANRTDKNPLSETAASDEWGFTTDAGTIATNRVDAEFLGTGADGVERFELTTRLTKRQCLTFESTVSQLHGVRVREIPDERNRTVDDTTNSVNSLTIDAPDGQDVVADDTYIVTEWESTRLNDGFQELSVIIAVQG